MQATYRYPSDPDPGNDWIAYLDDLPSRVPLEQATEYLLLSRHDLIVRAMLYRAILEDTRSVHRATLIHAWIDCYHDTGIIQDGFFLNHQTIGLDLLALLLFMENC